MAHIVGSAARKSLLSGPPRKVHCFFQAQGPQAHTADFPSAGFSGVA